MNVIWYPFGKLLAAIRFVMLITSMSIVVLFGLVLVKLNIADQKLAFNIRTFWSRLAVKILGIKVIQTGKPYLSDGTLYISNHRSLFDPMLLFTIIDHGYVVSKAEVANYPVVSTGAKLSGVIFVQRNNMNSRKDTKNSIEDYLKENKSILIFPEGTTSIDEYPLPFKKGSFIAAANTNRPVVSIALEMENPSTDFWYKEGLLSQFFVTYAKWQTKMYLHFFDPIQETDGNLLCVKCQDMIKNKLTEFHENWK